MAIQQTPEDKRMATEAATRAQRQPTPDERLEATNLATANDQKAVWEPQTGTFKYLPMNDSERINNSAAKQRALAAISATPVRDPTQNPNASAEDLANAAFGTPPPAPTYAQRGVIGDPMATAFGGSTGTLSGFRPTGSVQRSAPTGIGDKDPYTAPGAEAPTANREAVNKALAPVNQISTMLVSEAMQNRGLSAAEAQLREATAHAQSTALGRARAGNRRDRGLLERQAIGEGAFLEQEGGRQAATLRATEEQQNQQFRVDTLTKAGELGLNVAAYAVDLSKADLGSATNWINQEFAKMAEDARIKLGNDQLALGYEQLKLTEDELGQRKAESIMGFTRDMAAIQYQYDQLSTTDQNEADQLLMQKYGIDQQTMTALKQIKEAGKFRWDTMLSGMASGLGSGLTGGLSNLIGGAKTPAPQGAAPPNYGGMVY